MKFQRTDRRDNRPMTPEERLHEETDATRRRGDQAASELGGDDELSGDRLTKSGRLRIADVQQSEKKSGR